MRNTLVRLSKRIQSVSMHSTYSVGAKSSNSQQKQEDEDETSTFGFQEVNAKDKPKMVGDMFNHVASRYDLMNDIMSGGMHRIWKDYYVSKIGIFPEMRHLDVAGGTGDIAFRLVDRYSAAGYITPQVIICDLSPEMIKYGQQKVHKSIKETYRKQIEWLIGDAENLPFKSSSFDSYSIAFGIRNCTHVEIVLQEAYRVLKDGGCFSCLEFSHVNNSLFRSIYDFYSFNVIPWIGSTVAGDRRSYQYLVESIRNFPAQEPFAKLIKNAGFKDVRYENLMAGAVAIHTAVKLN